jgi:hypothetical protein
MDVKMPDFIHVKKGDVLQFDGKQWIPTDVNKLVENHTLKIAKLSDDMIRYKKETNTKIESLVKIIEELIK